jgi:FKBP-type peptidyl-prolyl cis-trans isomerase SlyD
MEGMQVGDSKEVSVPAEQAYGDVDPGAIVEVSKTDFPPNVPIEVGTPLQVRNMDGQILDARISDVQGDKVKLDFNHPLAGKDLKFNVTVVGLRNATQEELEHGHVHGEGDHEDIEGLEEDDYEDEADYIDEDDDMDDEANPDHRASL